MSLKEYEEKLREICRYYNMGRFKGKRVFLDYGGAGGYFSVNRVVDVVVPEKDFYRNRGVVGFDPYSQNMPYKEEEVRVEEEKNWREERREVKRNARVLGDEYTWAEERNPG